MDDLLTEIENRFRTIQKAKPRIDLWEVRYKEIQKHCVSLSHKEQREISSKLNEAFDTFVFWLVQYNKGWDLLLSEWKDRFYNKTKDVSKMGRDYNTSKRNHNSKVRTRLNEAFKSAEILIKDNQLIEACELIAKSGIHPKFLVTNEEIPILETVKNGKGSIVDVLNFWLGMIEHNRKELTLASMKIASDLANTRSAQLSGDVIEPADLFNVAMMSAYEGTLVYSAERSNASFTTWVYKRMLSDIGKFTSENSRTVAIPRGLIEQYSLLEEAAAEVNSFDFEQIAIRANHINAQRKKSSRKLTVNELFTPKRVEEILTYVGETLSLDNSPLEEDEDKTIPWIENLASIKNGAEERLELANVKERLYNIVKKVLEDEEWDLLSVRWGLAKEFTEPQKMDTVVALFKVKHPNSKMNKSKLREIENRAINKLRQCGGDELKTLWEATESIRLKEE